MPACFQLVDKTTNEPVNLVFIDDAYCAHIGITPHYSDYYAFWYDHIGFLMACGRSYDELKEIFKDDEKLYPMLLWLEERYTINCFHSSH